MIVLEIYEETSSVVRRDDFELPCNLEISSYVLDSELREIKLDGLLSLTLTRHTYATYILPSWQLHRMYATYALQTKSLHQHYFLTQ